MKVLLASIAAGVVVLGAWQRGMLVELRGETARLVSTLHGAHIRLEPQPKDGEEAKSPDVPAVTDSQLADFTASALALRDEFARPRWNIEDGFAHPILCETLARLTTAQLHAVVDAWMADRSPENERHLIDGIQRFMDLAGEVNSAATVPLMYELNAQDERLAQGFYPALQHWFRHDAEGLLEWTQQTEIPEGFESASWADAVLATREPSVENVRKLIGHKFRWYMSADAPGNLVLNEVALKLQTHEDRLAFLTSLHAATDGVYDDLGCFVYVFAQRTPFTQLAYLADHTPAFKPSRPNRSVSPSQKQPLGSLRYEVAARSHDGTAAQRWDWLIQRTEDRPSGSHLGLLVSEWCVSNYGDTAAWVRSFPPGSDRDTATNAVIAFLEANGGRRLVSEWKPQ